MDIKSAPSGAELIAAQQAWNAIRTDSKASAADKAKVHAVFEAAFKKVRNELTGNIARYPNASRAAAKAASKAPAKSARQPR